MLSSSASRSGSWPLLESKSAPGYVEYLFAWTARNIAGSTKAPCASPQLEPSAPADRQAAVASSEGQSQVEALNAVLQLRDAPLLSASEDRSSSGSSSRCVDILASLHPVLKRVHLADWVLELDDAVQWLSEGSTYASTTAASAVASQNSGGSHSYATQRSLAIVRAAIVSMTCRGSFSPGTAGIDDSMPPQNVVEGLLKQLPPSPSQEGIGYLVMLLMHPHAYVRVWARESILTCITNATWTQEEEEEEKESQGTQQGEDNETASASGDARTCELRQGLHRFRALWELGVRVLCALRHVKNVPLSATSPSLPMPSYAAVADVFFSICVVLTTLDQRITSVTETLAAAMAADSSSGDSGLSGIAAHVRKVHPVTLLLLGGTMALQWLFATLEVLSSADMRHHHQHHHSAATTYSHPLLARVAPSVLRRAGEAISQQFKSDSTLVPASLAVDAKKSLIKVLVHVLLDAAKAVPTPLHASSGGATQTPAEARKRSRMRCLWLLASYIDAPPLGSAAATATPAPGKSAGWMVRVLLRNAQVQLDYPAATTEARQRPAKDVTKGVAATAAGGRSEPSKLLRAAYGTWALLSSLNEALPSVAASLVFHDCLETHEQDLLALAIGATLRERCVYGPWLLRLLLLADVRAFSCSGGVSLGTQHMPLQTPARCLQRVWSHTHAIVRQAIKDAVPGALLLMLLEAVVVVVEVPNSCLWVLTGPELTSSSSGGSGPAPLAWQVRQCIEGVSEVLTSFGGQAQRLWEEPSSLLSAAATSASPPPIVQSVNSAFCVASAPVGGGAAAAASSGGGGAWSSSSVSAAAASRLLSSGSPLPRLTHVLYFGRDPLLSRLADNVSIIFFRALSPTVHQSFRSDAAQWVWARVLLRQSLFSTIEKNSSSCLLLAIGNAKVDNAARAQGKVWLHVLCECGWSTLPASLGLAAWWMTALLADVVSLTSQERSSLITRVVPQLPQLLPPSPENDGFVDPAGKEEMSSGEMYCRMMKVALSAASCGMSEIDCCDDATTADRSAGIDEDGDKWNGRNGGNHGKDESEAEATAVALLSSRALYDVVKHLWMCLARKHVEYALESFISAILHVSGALPACRVQRDRSFRDSVAKLLVPLHHHMSADQAATLRQYAPAWLAQACEAATRSIDARIEEQDKCFQQYEWLEKQEAGQRELEAQQAAVEEALRKGNETKAQQQVRQQQLLLGQRPAATSGRNALASLAAVTAAPPQVAKDDAPRGGELSEDWDDMELEIVETTTHTAANVRVPVPTAVKASELGASKAVAQHYQDELTRAARELLTRRRPQASLSSSGGIQQTLSFGQKPLSAASSTTASARPTPLQKYMQSVNDRLVQKVHHVASEEELQRCLRRIAASTNLLSTDPGIGDIIGEKRMCLSTEIPSVPETFVAFEDSGDARALASSNALMKASQLYVASFSPHVALELRWEVHAKIDEFADACRKAGTHEERRCLQQQQRRRKRTRDHQDEALQPFPLAAYVFSECLPVRSAGRLQSDSLDPTRVRYAIASAAVTQDGGSRAAAGAPLTQVLSEDDVLLVLLPLASLLPLWVKFLRTQQQQPGYVDPNSAAVGLSDDDEEAAKALYGRVPPLWRTLGCLPRVCYVEALEPGQRTAVLCTYPVQVDAARGETTSSGAAAQSNGEGPIPFSHALHTVFDSPAQSFFVKRVTSLNSSVASTHALHAISGTHFASTMFDPLSEAIVSKQYYQALEKHMACADTHRAMRSKMVCEKGLNDWQVSAVAAVLFAASPTWPQSVNESMLGLFGSGLRNNSDSSSDGVAASGTATSPVAAPSSSSSMLLLPNGTRSPNVLIIEGPPGTGKTQTIATLSLNLLKRLGSSSAGGGGRTRILVCAPSNCAVDETLLRFAKLRAVANQQHQYHQQRPGAAQIAMLDGSLVRVGVKESVDAAVLAMSPVVFFDDMVDKELRAAGSSAARSRSGGGTGQSRVNEIKERLLNSASIVFSTLGSLSHVQRRGVTFDLVIVDEASQGTEPDVLQALLLTKGKCVLVGDSKQLQPTVLCEPAGRRGLRRSLLARLLRTGHRSFLLRTQYRMQPGICAFPNAYFYEGKLLTSPGVVARHTQAQSIAEQLHTLPRFAFVDVAHGVLQHGRGRSLSNAREAEAVVQHMRQVRSYLRMTVRDFAREAGIITYYAAQVSMLRRQLTREELESGLQVATVDSFQGKEKSIIFISCVRTLRKARETPAVGRAAAASIGIEMDGGDETTTKDGSERCGSPVSSPTDQGRSNSSRSVRHLLGFLSDWHRINVSLTRARELCVVYGSASLFEAAASLAGATHCISSSGGAVSFPKHDATGSDQDPLVMFHLMQHAKQSAQGRLERRERSVTSSGDDSVIIVDEAVEALRTARAAFLTYSEKVPLVRALQASL